MKANLVLQMKNRIHKICHPDFYQQNIKKLHEIFKTNSYPEIWLRKLLSIPIDRRPMTEEAPHPMENEQQEVQKFGTLPNIDGLTQQLRKILKPTNTKIAVKNIKTVGSLYSKTKDKTNTMNKSNVVYRIPCKDCPAAYIGQTSRTLKMRIISHKSDCKTGNNTCALAEHIRDNQHQMNYEEAKILDIDTATTRRCFKEMCRIQQEENCNNKKGDIDKLSHIYSYLIHIDKRPRERQRSEREHEEDHSMNLFSL